jgi:phosphatidylserine synthase
MTENLTEKKQNTRKFREAFTSTKTLIGCYVVLNVATVVAIVLLRNHPDIVTDAVWVRSIIVLATSLLMASFASHAARGNSRSYLRLRLVSAIMVIAIVVIIALPGAFPVWLKIEQGVCGVILLGVVLIVNSKRMRSLFSAK